MNRQHTLSDSATNTITTLTLSSNRVQIAQNKAGKIKSSEKDFATPEEAEKHFEKKEWELLKKGFVLSVSRSTPGEPVLHFFVGGGYTGSLEFENTPQGIYLYKHGWANSPTDQKDFLIRINTMGTLQETIELPDMLVWNIVHRPDRNTLLLQISHYIFEYECNNGEFFQLTHTLKTPASFLTASPTTVAYATHPTLLITDSKLNITLRQSFDVTIINGTIPLAAVLSKNGTLLALHTAEGKIDLLNPVDGKLVRQITGDFKVISQLEFVANDTLLVLREHWGKWNVRYIDLTTDREIEFEGLALPSHTQEAQGFCFNADQSRLAIVQRTTAYIFDFTQKKFLHSFKIDHAVKTVKPKFINDYLGLRTDYGCFSLYTV